MNMAVTAFILALLLAVASLSLAEDHHYYVSAANGKDCPADSDCHSLSYYLSDPELYFTSNTQITFLEGTHLLDREKPIKISQVTGLNVVGRGRWVRGPEETIMESTAVIYCTKGSGGFAIYNSSRIAIIDLSLINCGALYYDAKVLNGYFYTTLLLSNISTISLTTVSIQNSTGHGLFIYNSRSAFITFLSIAYSNIDRESNTLQCNKLVNGSNLMILFYSAKEDTTKQFLFQNSNFTDGCVCNSQYGSVILYSVNSHSVELAMQSVEVVQRVANGSNGIVIWSDNSLVDFRLIKSKVKGAATKHVRGIGLKAVASSLSYITIDKVSFIDNSGGHLSFEYQDGIISGLTIKNTLFLHRDVPEPDQYGVYIFISNGDIRAAKIILQNISMSLGNAFLVGFLLKIKSTVQQDLPVIGDVMFQDSLFSANRNMKSVVSLVVDRPVQITNSNFFNNSGGSVISVSTTDQLLNNNVKFANNSMTAVAVWNGVVQFNGSNEIQNNHGTGIFLQGSSFIKVNGKSELTFLNNTARTVGGAIHVNDMRTFPNDYCSILVSDDSQIIFSGNQAVEGGGDVYGARLIDCLDIDNNRVLRQGQPNETSWYFNIPQSHTMQFNNTDTLSSFSSDPIMVCFCESGFPNCSKRFLCHESLFPGQEVVTEIATVGNYGGTSSGTVSIAVHNATLVRPYGPQGTTAQCLKLHLLLESVNPTSASVAITVNGGLPEWGVTLVVDIIECPPGFHKNEQSGRCECAPILKNYNISCIAKH